MTQPTDPTARIEDVGIAYADLLEELHAQAFHRPGDETWTSRAFSDVINTPSAFCLLATSDDLSDLIPWGFSACRVIAGSAELLSLGVVPSYQRLGVARQLIKESQRRCRKIGATELFLEVAQDNPAAQSLYVSMGFEQVGTRKDYYRRLDGKRVDARTMRISLEDVPV